MKVRELIELLQTFPATMDVYLATKPKQTINLWDVRSEPTRAGEILLLSGPGVWRVPKPA